MKTDDDEPSDNDSSMEKMIPNEDIKRISIKEKLKKIVQEERKLNTSARTRTSTKVITNKVKATTKVIKNNIVKNNNKQKVNNKITKKDMINKSNKVSDEEWDILPCKDVIHRERKATTMKMIVCPEKIVNVRKGKGWKLEVMVEYNTGETQWTFLHGAVAEMPELTKTFMEDCMIDYIFCGYNSNPEKYKKNKKISQYDDYKRHEDDSNTYDIATKFIHNNLRTKIYNTAMVLEVDKQTDEETELCTPEKLTFEDDINEHNNETNSNSGNKEMIIHDIDIVKKGTNIADEVNKENNSSVNNDVDE
jgi:hypothetical protein